MFHLLLFYLYQGGGKYLLIAGGVGAIIWSWVMAWHLVEWKLRGKAHARRAARTLAVRTIKIAVLLIATQIIFGMALVGINNHADPARVARNDALLMQWDARVFHVYVPFWWQGAHHAPIVDRLSPFLIGAYGSLDIFIACVVLITIYKSHRLFLKFYGAFCVCMALSAIGWFFLPALTPLDAYWHPMLPAAVPHEIARARDAYHPNASLDAALNNTTAHEQNAGAALVITTFPSLHVALATIALWFGALAEPWLLVVLIPYFILNALATSFVLQHYGVDAIGGAIVGVVAILFIHAGALVLKKFRTRRRAHT